MFGVTKFVKSFEELQVTAGLVLAPVGSEIKDVNCHPFAPS